MTIGQTGDKMVIENKRMQREKEILKLMVGLYCRKNHGLNKELCLECRELLGYAYRQLDKCKFGENKPACNKCLVHCYRKDMREKIRRVMKYSGPRMLFVHPLATIEHLLR